jgi:CheW-like domain
MSAAEDHGAARAALLRAEFDRGFGAAPTLAVEGGAAFLAIRIGGDPFALRLGDLLGVHVDRKVVPLPSAAPTLMGIASFRGVLTPVHDLRLLLGYPARTAARWLVRVAGRTPVGLAFEALEGQFTAASLGGGAPGADPEPPRDGESRARARAPARASVHTRGVVQALDSLRPVVDIGAVLATLGHTGAASRVPQER